MYLITRQWMADAAFERWRTQYGHYPSLKLHSGLMAEVVAQKLKDLGPNPNPDQVDLVVGNPTWTLPPGCRGGCKKDQGVPVVCFEGSEYDFYLCLDCAKKAVELLEGK